MFKKLSYDKQFLYMQSSGHEEKIALINVKMLSESDFKMGGSHVWRVGFEDEKGQEKEVRFLPGFFFQRFKQQVMRNYPSTTILTGRIL